MSLKNKFLSYELGGLVGTLLVAVVGLGLLFFDSTPSQFLTRSSYDWSFDLTRFASPNVKNSGVVIVYIDEKSLRDLKQPENAPMDRRLQAQLLKQLKQDGAKAVAMDVVFSDPGPSPAADAELAEAIHSNGRVVLGVDYNRPAQEDNGTLLKGGNGGGRLVLQKPLDEVLTYPYTPFRERMAKGGLVTLTYDIDFVARKHVHRLDQEDLATVSPAERSNAPPSLSWAAAQVAGVKLTHEPAGQPDERWIYYYGLPGEAIPGISYEHALDNQDPAFFRDKVVFVGALPITGNWTDKRDELRSPFSASTSPPKPRLVQAAVIQ